MTIRPHGPLGLSFLAFAAMPALAASLGNPTASVPGDATELSADEEIERRYDVRATLASGTPAPFGINMGLHVSVSRIDNLEPDSYDVPLDGEPQVAADDLEYLVQAAIEATDGAEFSSIRLRGGHITVTGNQLAQDAAAKVLAEVEALMLDKVAVEILRIPRTSNLEPFGSLLDAPAFDAMLDSHPSVTRSKQHVRVGRRTIFKDTEIKSYLFDYDVEVAQGAATGDPVVSVLQTGVDIGIRVDRAADGRRFVVRAWGRQGDSGRSMRKIKIPSLAGAAIEFPSVVSSIWTSSALVERGGAIVVDYGDEELLLIRVTDTQVAGGSAPLSLGELALRPMRPNLMQLPRTEPSQGWCVHDEYFRVREASWMSNMDDADDVLENLILGTNAEGLVETVGSGLIALGGSGGSALQSEVARLAETTPYSTFEIDVRYQVQDTAPSGDEESLSDFVNDPATKRLACTTMRNDATLLVHGTESAYLQDYDFQIAAGAMIGDPIIKTIFTGAAVWCSPMRASTGEIHAWFDIQVQETPEVARDHMTATFYPAPGSSDKDEPRLQGEMRADMPIQMPVTNSAMGRSFASLADGKWTTIMTQPIGKDGRLLTVVAKIVAR